MPVCQSVTISESEKCDTKDAGMFLYPYLPIGPQPAASLCAKECPVRKRGPREKRPPRRTFWP